MFKHCLTILKCNHFILIENNIYITHSILERSSGRRQLNPFEFVQRMIIDVLFFSETHLTNILLKFTSFCTTDHSTIHDKQLSVGTVILVHNWFAHLLYTTQTTAVETTTVQISFKISKL